MTTTSDINTRNRKVRHLFVGLVFLFGSAALQAQRDSQSYGNNQSLVKEEATAFAYTFQVKGIYNRAEAKQFAESSRGLFDGVPVFDEKTGWFTCHTTYALDGGDVRLKIEWMGYELNQFKAMEIRE
jgi:hypothetical protein